MSNFMTLFLTYLPDLLQDRLSLGEGHEPTQPNRLARHPLAPTFIVLGQPRAEGGKAHFDSGRNGSNRV